MRKFLIGCGVVLGLFLLAGIVGSWFLVHELKQEIPNLKQVDSQQKELRERFGRIDEFVPPLQSGVDEERLSLYISVREAVPIRGSGFVDQIAEVADREKRMKEAKGLNKIREAYRTAKEGMGVARVAMDAMALRDSVLLARGMGPGEYLYYTVLGPIIALDFHPPACEPRIDDELDSAEMTKLQEAPRSLMAVFRKQLANGRRELRGLQTRSEEEEAWLLALDDELEQGRIGDTSASFVEGLPPATVERLAPYRERLEASLPRCREAWSLELLVIADEEERGVQIHIDNHDDE
jgi:uncharacterized protein YhaN